jgi:F0F1-type ATP synthase membrane subunit b/b'
VPTDLLEEARLELEKAKQARAEGYAQAREQAARVCERASERAAKEAATSRFSSAWRAIEREQRETAERIRTMRPEGA